MRSMLKVTLFILAISELWIGSANCEDKRPSVNMPETRYAFTPVLEGEVVVHDFVIQNHGSAEVVIEGVETG